MDVELVKWLDHRDSLPPESMTHALTSSKAVNLPQLSAPLSPTTLHSHPAPPPTVTTQSKPTYHVSREVRGLASRKRSRLPDSQETVEDCDGEDYGVIHCPAITAQPIREQVRFCMQSGESTESQTCPSFEVGRSISPPSTRHQVAAQASDVRADVKASGQDPIGTGYASQECSKGSSCDCCSCRLTVAAAAQQGDSSSCRLAVAAALQQGGSSSGGAAVAAALQQGGSSSGQAAGCVPLNSPCGREGDKHVPVRPVCVDISSMGSLGLIPDAAFLLRVVHTALKSINRCAAGDESGYTIICNRFDRGFWVTRNVSDLDSYCGYVDRPSRC